MKLNLPIRRRNGSPNTFEDADGNYLGIFEDVEIAEQVMALVMDGVKLNNLKETGEIEPGPRRLFVLETQSNHAAADEDKKHVAQQLAKLGIDAEIITVAHGGKLFELGTPVTEE